MMNSDCGTPAYASSAGYSTVETLLDEAASNLRRYSRGSSGQRTSGSMRVVKPSSTSNSPRGAIGLGRRRTVMTDSRRRIMMDQNTGAFTSNDVLQNPMKSNRPVSWHPSSHLGQRPIYQPAYPMQYQNTSNEFHIFDLPPTPTVYSGYVSPASTFSPLSMPFTGYEEQQNSYMDPSPYQASTTYPQQQEFVGDQVHNYISTPSDYTQSTMDSHFNWSNFAANGFDNSTAPPTPENFLPIQHPDPTFPKEEAIPYHSLSDPTEEDEGEILCGMGLYDNPEVGKTPPSDPHLDNYRSSLMSQLLGPTYRREPSGKGLKLEETWNPPQSDDEEEEDDDNDDDDDEQDGEGEDEDTTIEVGKVEGATTCNPELQQSFPSQTQSSNHPPQSHDRISWL